MVEPRAPASTPSEQPRTGPQAATFTPPTLRARHVYLRAVTQADYGFLQDVELNSDLATRWRFRGSTPSPEAWHQTFWNGVLVQFMVVSRRDDRPIGLIALYRANFQHRHAFLLSTRFDLSSRSPLMMLGFSVFLDYVFATWDFRKIYLEVPEYNFGQFASGQGRYFTLEGRLRDHSFNAGRWWDELFLAIYRDAWLTHRDRVSLPRGRRAGAPATGPEVDGDLG